MLDGVVIDDTELHNDKLQEWEDFYNFNRPHGGLDGQTPYERLNRRPRTRVSDQRQLHTPGWAIVGLSNGQPNGEVESSQRQKGPLTWKDSVAPGVGLEPTTYGLTVRSGPVR